MAILLLSNCSSLWGQTKAEKQGWKLSMQSYIFHLFSVTESLDKSRELGLHYIEICPGQRMGEGFVDAVFGYNLTTEEQNRLKGLAKEKGTKIRSFLPILHERSKYITSNRLNY